MYEQVFAKYSNKNLVLPGCIFSQLLLLPGSVSSPKVLIGCSLQALERVKVRVLKTFFLRFAQRRQASIDSFFGYKDYLNETLSEFFAGLARCCLDSHHREL